MRGRGKLVLVALAASLLFLLLCPVRVPVHLLLSSAVALALLVVILDEDLKLRRDDRGSVLVVGMVLIALCAAGIILWSLTPAMLTVENSVPAPKDGGISGVRELSVLYITRILPLVVLFGLFYFGITELQKSRYREA